MTLTGTPRKVPEATPRLGGNTPLSGLAAGRMLDPRSRRVPRLSPPLCIGARNLLRGNVWRRSYAASGSSLNHDVGFAMRSPYHRLARDRQVRRSLAEARNDDLPAPTTACIPGSQHNEAAAV